MFILNFNDILIFLDIIKEIIVQYKMMMKF